MILSFSVSQHTPVHCGNVQLGKFSIFSLIHVYNVHCMGLVKKSPSILCGQNVTLTSHFFILSLAKKYHSFRCRVLQLLDILLFFANKIVLLLSW